MDKNVDADIVIVGAGIYGLATALAFHLFPLFSFFFNSYSKTINIANFMSLVNITIYCS